MNAKTEEQRLQEAIARRHKKDQKRALDNFLFTRETSQDEDELQDARDQALRAGVDLSWIE